jgi:hypothetical protein
VPSNSFATDGDILASKLNMPLPSPVELENTTSTSSPEPKQEAMKANVRFSKECRLRMYSSGMTAKKLKYKTWHSDSEYQSMREECLLTIRLAKSSLKSRAKHQKKNQGNPVCIGGLESTLFRLDEEYSCRGLEHIIYSKARRLRIDRRIQALSAVYHEQVRQYDSGSFNPERIAEIYRQISDTCQREAHARALQYWNEEHDDTPPPMDNNANKNSCFDHYQDQDILQDDQDTITTCSQ